MVCPQADLFTQEGYEVLMMDYPGYGKSRGERSESKIYQWAAWVYQLARKNMNRTKLFYTGKAWERGLLHSLRQKRLQPTDFRNTLH